MFSNESLEAGAVEQGAESVLSDVDRLFVHM